MQATLEEEAVRERRSKLAHMHLLASAGRQHERVSAMTSQGGSRPGWDALNATSVVSSMQVMQAHLLDGLEDVSENVDAGKLCLDLYKLVSLFDYCLDGDSLGVWL